MKKFYLILAAVLCSASLAFAATRYNFESGELEGWTAIDADGDGYNWAVGASSKSYSGNYVVFSESFSNDARAALTPDNWLISPLVDLGGFITFMAEGRDASFAEEHFAIYAYP